MFFRGVFLVAAAILLVACSTKREDRIGCPNVEVPRDVGAVTRFHPGPGRDPIDVLLEAWVESVKGQCTLDDNNLLVDLTVKVVTRRGPADRTESAEIPYFVAISDLQHNILSRQSFNTTAPYVSRKSISFEDILTLTIPMTKGVEPESFLIYVGLELNEEELKYNRNKNKR
jgi:hypothetical protein